MIPEYLLILMIFAIPLFFVWRRIFKKKIVIWIATLISAFVIYIGIFTVWFSIITYYPNKEFNPHLWAVNKDKRYELSQSIIDSQVLIGKTKADVREILGDEGGTDQSDQWTYDLGYKPSFANIEPDVLIIEFKDGKVIKVTQRET